MEDKNSTIFKEVEKLLQSSNLKYSKNEVTGIITTSKIGKGYARHLKVGLILQKKENGQVKGIVTGIKDFLFEGDAIAAIHQYLNQCRELKISGHGRSNDKYHF